MAIGTRLLYHLFFGVLAVAQVPKDWRQFTSSEGGYVVRYPKSWHLLDPGLPTLYVSSFPPSRRVKAVIVPANGATISIAPAPLGVKDIEQWVARDAAVTKVRSRSLITLQPIQPTAPLRIVEIEFEPLEGPDAISWYFDLAGRLLVANLSYWSGDPSREEYYRVLRAVVESVQTPPR